MKAVATEIGIQRRSAIRASIAFACAAFALCAGCASTEAARMHSAHTGAAQLTVVGSASPSESAALAAREHEGDFSLTGLGESMQPVYTAGTAIVVHPTSYFMLRSGMPVVYVSHNGHQIAHVLVEESNRGWVAQGLNNQEPDEELVTSQNLVGIITCAYVPLASPAALKGDTFAVVESRSSGLLH